MTHPQKSRKSGSRKIADFHAFVEMKSHGGKLIFAIVWTSGDDGRTARAFHIEPKSIPASVIRAIASGAGKNAEKFANHSGFIDKRCRLGSRFDKMRGTVKTCSACGSKYRTDDEKGKSFKFGKNAPKTEE